MAFGKLGAGFGRLGAMKKAAAGGGGGGGGAPNLDFSVAGNSQYQPMVISMNDDPYADIDADLMGIRYKGPLS